MNTDFTLGDAIAIASEAHRNQLDKSGLPYILHPLRVMERSGNMWDGDIHSDKLRIVGVLHDVIEDTDLTIKSLREKGLVDQEVLIALEAITKRELETNSSYIARVKVNTIATLVKIADTIDNTLPERMSKLDKKTQDRLKIKYKKTFQELL